MAGTREQEVEAGGLRFETLVGGPEDGEPVLLLHGYPQSNGSWRETVDWLAGRGYRAIAPNLRGYSPGANPRDAAEYAMRALVGDVTGIADSLGVDRFHLVGHDWGGALAWAVASAHPDRLLSLTVLSTPHPAALLEALRTSTQLLRSSYMGFFKVPRVPELVLSAANFAQLGLSVRATGLPREAWERDRAQLERVGLRGPLNWYRGATRSSGGGRQRRIAVPTLFIWGHRDPFLGRRAAELTEKWVGSQYHFAEIDAGHWIAENNSTELQLLLGNHLAEHPASPAPQSARAAPRRPRPRRPA